jgi:acetyl esterase/lipase
MAINNMMRAALQALSYPELDTKKNYKLQRKLINIANRHYLKPFYKNWDYQINSGDHTIPVRIFSSEPELKARILIFFHGGGWVTGNIDSYDKVCTLMAKMTGCTVISVDYRLAPEHKFPAAPEDCYFAAKEVFEHASLVNSAPERITLIGDSAGANLAAAVSLMARDRGEFMPRKQILIYPSVSNDHTENSPFASVRKNGTGYLLTSKRICDYMELYMKDEDDLNNPYFAPLMAPDLSRQPDTLIITAEYDPLRDEGEAYGELLRESGNRAEICRMPDALHGFFSLGPTFSHVKKSYELINRFLKS